MTSIDIKQLKQIIKEEIQKINEDISDEIKQSSSVQNTCADLIKSIEKFKSNASESAKSHVGLTALDELVEKLKFVATNSMKYIDSPTKPNPAVKKAVFKPSSE